MQKPNITVLTAQKVEETKVTVFEPQKLEKPLNIYEKLNILQKRCKIGKNNQGFNFKYYNETDIIRWFKKNNEELNFGLVLTYDFITTEYVEVKKLLTHCSVTLYDTTNNESIVINGAPFEHSDLFTQGGMKNPYMNKGAAYTYEARYVLKSLFAPEVDELNFEEVERQAKEEEFKKTLFANTITPPLPPLPSVGSRKKINIVSTKIPKEE